MQICNIHHCNYKFESYYANKVQDYTISLGNGINWDLLNIQTLTNQIISSLKDFGPLSLNGTLAGVHSNKCVRL